MDKYVDILANRVEDRAAPLTHGAAVLVGSAIVFSGSIIDFIRPPVIFDWSLLSFYVTAVLVLLFAGIEKGVGVDSELRIDLVNLIFYISIFSIGSLVTFMSANLLSDWREKPFVTDLVVPKLEVAPGETLVLDAKVKNPNDGTLKYVWSASSGELLDDSGPKAVWKAPAEPGMAELTVGLNPVPGKQSVSVTVRERPYARDVGDFVHSCIDSFKTSYEDKIILRSAGYATVMDACYTVFKMEPGLVGVEKSVIGDATDEVASTLKAEELENLLEVGKRPSDVGWRDRRKCCSKEFPLWPFCKRCPKNDT